MSKPSRKTSQSELRPVVLVVDDDEAMREVLRLRIAQWGYRVETAADAGQAKDLVLRRHPEIVLSDVVMPEASGLELLSSLQEVDPGIVVVLMTAHGTVDMAVEAMKAGARDFITKPISYEELEALLEGLSGELQDRRDAAALSHDLEDAPGLANIVGASKPMREVFDLIRKLARTDASVLITGESGTGKELVARAIHDLSPREGPFVAINSAAIPAELMESEILGHEKGAFTGATSRREGCFELAATGTLFLDEIAEMPTALQPKLLRILEDGRVRRLGGRQEFEVDVRILSATNRSPEEAIAEGRLREDLYYRLNVFTIHLPPLAERGDDVLLLAHHFARFFNRKHERSVEGLSERARAVIREHGWPGNVRELRNVMERAVVLASGKWIEPQHLPAHVNQAQGRPDELAVTVGTSLADAEKQLIMKTLEASGDNKAEAARRLGVDVKTIRNKLRRYESEG